MSSNASVSAITAMRRVRRIRAIATSPNTGNPVSASANTGDQGREGGSDFATGDATNITFTDVGDPAAGLVVLGKKLHEICALAEHDRLTVPVKAAVAIKVAVRLAVPDRCNDSELPLNVPLKSATVNE